MYRPPICSVLGHVDAGKTLFLDALRKSTIQKDEPGGITQKIGVSYFDKDALREMVGETKSGVSLDIPGIIFVDTPGHECFTTQRLIGAEISDLAILIVDVFKGIEQQTIECLKYGKNFDESDKLGPFYTAKESHLICNYAHIFQ